MLNPERTHLLHTIGYQREAVSAIGGMRIKGSSRQAVPDPDPAQRADMRDASSRDGSARLESKHQCQWVERR